MTDHLSNLNRDLAFHVGCESDTEAKRKGKRKLFGSGREPW